MFFGLRNCGIMLDNEILHCIKELNLTGSLKVAINNFVEKDGLF